MPSEQHPRSSGGGYKLHTIYQVTLIFPTGIFVRTTSYAYLWFAIPCVLPRSATSERRFRRALFELRSRARFVCPARASCAARLLATDRGNPAGAANRGRLLWVTFLGKTRKVTSRRATPGTIIAQPPSYSQSE